MEALGGPTYSIGTLRAPSRSHPSARHTTNGSRVKSPNAVDRIRLGALVGTAIFVAGTALLFAVVLHPNASLWARTVWRAPVETNRVALTFDDGPDPKTTRSVARILSERDVRAAFFVVGERALAHPEIVAELHAAGHLVSNHSHTHSSSFHFGLWDRARRELRARTDLGMAWPMRACASTHIT